MATTDGSPNWEDIARDQLERRAKRLADDLGDAVRTLGGRIGRGTADPDDVVDARMVFEEAIHVLEEDLAPAAGAEDHGNGDSRYIRNDGVAATYLDLTMEQVHDADGSIVELDSEAVRELARGRTVKIETAGGIPVVLTLEDPNYGVNSGQ